MALVLIVGIPSLLVALSLGNYIHKNGIEESWYAILVVAIYLGLYVPGLLVFGRGRVYPGSRGHNAKYIEKSTESR